MTNDITQADRELLAAEYRKDGFGRAADEIEKGQHFPVQRYALRAIAAARVQAAPAVDGGECEQPTQVDATPVANRLIYPDGSKAPWSNGPGHWPETVGCLGKPHGWEYAFSAPPSAPVDDAMVERAVDAYWKDCASPTQYEDSHSADRGHMRAALTAALNQP